jgi:transposase
MESTDQLFRRPNVFYPDSFKLEVCKELIETGVSKSFIRKKYGIAGGDSINQWLRKFGFESFDYKDQGRKQAENLLAMKKKEAESVEDLKKRIKALERELEDARLRERAAELTIDFAEKQLNIKIRKKSGTK